MLSSIPKLSARCVREGNNSPEAKNVINCYKSGRRLWTGHVDFVESMQVLIPPFELVRPRGIDGRNNSCGRAAIWLLVVGEMGSGIPSGILVVVDG